MSDRQDWPVRGVDRRESDVRRIRCQRPMIPCGERYTILKALKQQYDEQRTAFGVTADGRLLEVVVSPRGSWTILLTRPGGLTCLVTSGDGWQQIVEPRDEPIT